MPSADKLQWPQGNPLFEVQWRSIADGLTGNGIVNSGDFEVTTTATAMEVQVEPGTMYYLGTDYDLGAAETHVLSDGDANDDRWDTVYFDTDTTASNVREGTPGQNPEPPDVEGNEILLGIVYVPAGAIDVSDSEVLNWRPEHQKAENVRLEDTADDFDATEIENAFTEVIREAGDPLTGNLDLTDFAGDSPLHLGDDPGNFGAIVDAVATSDATAGDAVSYTFNLGGVVSVRVSGEADGSGGVQNLQVEFEQTLVVSEDIEDNDSTTIWDSTKKEVPQGQLGGPASSLTEYPLSLKTDTDRDLDGADLDDGVTTVYDASAEWVPRPQVEDRHVTEATDASYTTDDEEVIFVDSSVSVVTITLSSEDAEDGNVIQVVDVGGSAAGNEITIDTEGEETIDGNDSETVGDNYGGLAVISDGKNWFSAGGGTGSGGGDGSATDVSDDGETVVEDVINIDARENLSVEDDGAGGVHIDAEEPEFEEPTPPKDIFGGDKSGEVSNADEETVVVDRLDPETGVEIAKAVLTTAYAEAVPEGVDLSIVTFDNEGGFDVQETVLSGDGSTVYDRELGDPLVSYGNLDEEKTESVGVVVENTSGATVNVMAVVEGEIVGQVADLELAQMLSRRQNEIRATQIEAWTGTSERKSQVLARRRPM